MLKTAAVGLSLRLSTTVGRLYGLKGMETLFGAGPCENSG